MTAPEVLHADLLQRAAVQFEGKGGKAAVLGRDLSDALRAALRALGDTVPREKFDRAWASWERTDARADRAERERDEARAERDALAAREAQVRAVREAHPDGHLGRLDVILDTDPAVSLALHDAEVLESVAGALGQFTTAEALRYRAAAIREKARRD